ncbi:MAG: guanylate kinase [Acidobacteriota bacterium]
MSNEMKETSIDSPGSLIVVAGPSGAGKSTIVQRALKKIDRLKFSISYTTRNPRSNEQNGVDYFFVSRDEFLALRDRGEFLEYAEVHGHLYGTSRSQVAETARDGTDVILDIDVQGAEQIRRRMAEAITVFILPPSREIVEERLRARNLNSPEDIERRMANASSEVQMHRHFKYVIVNDDLGRATAALEAIIIAERHRTDRQRKIAESILETFGGAVDVAQSDKLRAPRKYEN